MVYEQKSLKQEKYRDWLIVNRTKLEYAFDAALPVASLIETKRK